MQSNPKNLPARNLVDTFGRQISYLRLSVTDRCDLRCTYCMSKKMEFLPKADLLTLKELETVANRFIDRGVKKIRITGGEPLVRKDIILLLEKLGHRLGNGLDELTLTTNGTQLKAYAKLLKQSGVKRIKISRDSIDHKTFSSITRGGNLNNVLEGIDAAIGAGLAVKINTVVLKHDNANKIIEMIEWAHRNSLDITLIEVMPLGNTGEDRYDQYVPLSEIRDQLETQWTLSPQNDVHINAGPSRYYKIHDTGGRIGFITPLTNNFCANCNRVRVTCTGRIYMCLGQDDHIDLREAIRSSDSPDLALHHAIDQALYRKPERHNFAITKPNEAAIVQRHMSTTGG